MIFSQDLTIIISLISLGFFGGFTHCAGMCGPFVLTQVSNRLGKIPLEKFSTFQKLKNLVLLPYHLGRITTYAIIGSVCSIARKTLEDFTSFKIFSVFFLLTASLIFLNLLFEKKLFNFTKAPLAKFKKNLPFKSKTLNKYSLLYFFSKFSLSKLFSNPQGIRGYFLGIILGFIPCGLLYGAFLLSASITQPFLAAIGMILFGIATFPSLFLTASSGYIFLKFLNREFKIISKIIILINSVTLFIMAISLIN